MLKLLTDLHEDRNGAAFIEYTALLGVILAVGLILLTKVALGEAILGPFSAPS